MDRKEEFFKILQELEENPDVQKLQEFSQHNGNTTFQHCHNVAVCSFYLAEKWNWDVDLETLATGAMLHDYYLYGTEQASLNPYRHGITHPQTALENARECFDLNPKMENIIRSHMWPLSLSKLPHSKEAILVNISDKFCAFHEMSRGIRHIEEILGKKKLQGYY